MNLGGIERALLRCLREHLGDEIQWRRGPPQASACSGLLPEVFVHALRFEDPMAGAPLPPARWPLIDGAGWREERPAVIELLLLAQCGQHAQAQALAGLLVGPALAGLNRLADLRLSVPDDAAHRLSFRRIRAQLLHCQSEAAAPGAEAAAVGLRFRLHGVVEIELRGADRLAPPLDPEAPAIRLRIDADPRGEDLKAERVVICLDADEAPLDLGGWRLRDAAGHAYPFPDGQRLLPGVELSLWTRRGKADAGNLYWGRRRAVWNNTGDQAWLLDASGVERARAAWRPPLPG